MPEIKSGDTVYLKAQVIRVHGNPDEPDYHTANIQLLDGQGVLTAVANFTEVPVAEVPVEVKITATPVEVKPEAPKSDKPKGK